MAGAGLLVAADLSTLYEVRIPGGVRHAFSGGGRHGDALLVLGVVAVAMALGSLRGSVGAMGALGCLGVVALGIAIIGDVGDVHATGIYGQLYENATAGPGAGFYEETLAGVLLLAAGGTGLALMGAVPAGLRVGRRGGREGTEQAPRAEHRRTD
jgi:hypothetical protein